jgi:hypothetical protein
MGKPLPIENIRRACCKYIARDLRSGVLVIWGLSFQCGQAN